MQVTGRLGEHPHVVTVHDAGEHDGLAYARAARARGRLARRARRRRPGGGCRSRTSSASGARSRTRSPTRTRTASCTATSSRPTSGSTGRATPCSATSGSPPRRRRGLRPRIARWSGRRAYLSPEQARGDPATPASDLYGLGATLYELACGRPPFTAETAEALIAQHLHALPAPPSAHEPTAAPLDGAAAAAARQGPGERPPSAAARARRARAGRRRRPSRPRARRPRARRWRRCASACDEALAGGLARRRRWRASRGSARRACAEELAALRGAATASSWPGEPASEDEGAPAYWPWRRVLPRAGRGPGRRCPPPAPEAARTRRASRCGTASSSWLAGRAGQRPLAIVLEDVHWADPSSLGLLGAPGPRPARRAGAARGDSRTGRRMSSLQEALGRLAAPAFSEPRARGARRRRGRAARRDGGRPGGAGGGGRGVAARAHAAATRCTCPSSCARWRPTARRSRADCARSSRAARRRCRAPTREMLELAAVAGTEFSLPVVARAAELERGELLAVLEPALRDGLLARRRAPATGSPTRVTREVVYEAQPRAPRAERHARPGSRSSRRGWSASPTSRSPRSPTTR